MAKKPKILALILAFTLMLSPVFSETLYADDAGVTENFSDEAAVPDAITEDIKNERAQDYSEEGLIEIRTDGVYDADGNPIDPNVLLAKPGEGQPPTSIEAALDAYYKTLIENWGGQKVFTERRLGDIQQGLKEEKARFDSLSAKVKEAEVNLEPLHAEVKTLEDQVKLMNDQIQGTKDKITTIELRVAEKQLEIRDLMTEIRKSQIELEAQKSVVKDYIALVYKEEQNYIDLFDESSSTIKLLLADASVSESVLGQEYLKVIESTGRDVFYELEKKHRTLAEKQAKLKDDQNTLKKLYLSLNSEKQTLEEGKVAKQELLVATRGQESRYQELLDDSAREQLESAIAIQNMQDNIAFIQEKLKTLNVHLDQAAQEYNQKKEEISVSPSAEESVPTISPIAPDAPQTSSIFDWPVYPKAITAYFHDAHYPSKWGLHTGLDIRASMRTEIRAPADGYVAEAKDNGKGYSYIILAHKNNFMTVYGHVNQILVKPGMIVEKGTVIGLTGGMPGTDGAGLRTTGPHLHFEVYYKGELQNPLDYLPVYELPLEYIPQDYLELTPQEL